MVRHPDMPKVAFRDFWKTIQQVTQSACEMEQLHQSISNVQELLLNISKQVGMQMQAHDIDDVVLATVFTSMRPWWFKPSRRPMHCASVEQYGWSIPFSNLKFISFVLANIGLTHMHTSSFVLSLVTFCHTDKIWLKDVSWIWLKLPWIFPKKR